MNSDPAGSRFRLRAHRAGMNRRDFIETSAMAGGVERPAGALEGRPRRHLGELGEDTLSQRLAPCESIGGGDDRQFVLKMN
jgi:hypothetical protein